MDALTEESASPGMQSVVGIDKGWTCGSHASRPSKCVPHCQGDKNSLLDEIFQGPRGLCERGTLALLSPVQGFKGSDFRSRTLCSTGTIVMDASSSGAALYFPLGSLRLTCTNLKHAKTQKKRQRGGCGPPPPARNLQALLEGSNPLPGFHQWVLKCGRPSG